MPRLSTRWTFPARLVRVVDGDTVWIEFSLGFRATLTLDVRLANINCPEVVGPTRAAGLAATKAASDWFAALPAEPWPLTVETKRTDDYGRYIALVAPAAGGETLNDFLVRTGNAVAYDVGGGGVS